MNNKIRLGLLAVSAIAVLSLSACKTDEASQDSAPPAAQAAPADTSTPPADTGMPANDSSMPTNASTSPATP